MKNSLRILHTSDWHLGKYLENFSRLPEQEKVLEEIVSITNKQNIDLVLIAGDIFDTANPPIDAVKLFYSTLTKLSSDGTRPVIVIAGNHDSPDRIESALSLSLEHGVILAGYPNFKATLGEIGKNIMIDRSSESFFELRLPSIESRIQIIALPYVSEERMRKSFSTEKTSESFIIDYIAEKVKDEFSGDSFKLLLSHHFYTGSSLEIIEESEDERSIVSVGGIGQISVSKLPDGIDYVALGHIHKYHQLSGKKFPVIYSGSPIAYSLSEADQQKFVVVTEITKKETTIDKIPINSGKKIFRKEFNSPQDAIFWLKENPDALVEITLNLENYPEPKDLIEIRESHSGILNIIPFLRTNTLEKNSVPDIREPIEELFEKFFESKNKIKPNEFLKNLFSEVLNEDE
ncbi:MAG: exonuclease subunit SbcD [Leptospiraceae bacterium]|nr:exonuclease subunit SbcD [Leptospiraceae bacterium]